MIRVDVAIGGLEEIEKALGIAKSKSRLVLRTAINETAKGTKQLFADTAHMRYYVRKQDVKKTMSQGKKATTSNLQATVVSAGPAKSLYDFRVRPKIYNPGSRPKQGHTGNVARTNSAKKLYLRPWAKDDKYKAFITRFKSGHVAVVQRVPGKRMKSNPKKEAIKTLLSLSIPSMLGIEKSVYDANAIQIYELLKNNIQIQIERYLG